MGGATAFLLKQKAGQCSQDVAGFFIIMTPRQLREANEISWQIKQCADVKEHIRIILQNALKREGDRYVLSYPSGSMSLSNNISELLAKEVSKFIQGLSDTLSIEETRLTLKLSEL